MDFSQKFAPRSQDGSGILNLEDPTTGEPLENEHKEPIWIRLHGKDSDRYQKARRRLQNRRLGHTLKTAAQMKVSAELLEEDELELLGEITAEWSPSIEEGGKAIECTPANAKAFYQRHRWVKEQVDSFINDRANFLGNL